jgi:four helix bundle protein
LTRILEAVSGQRSAVSFRVTFAAMKDFRSLSVWHKAHELTLLVYRETQAFPREELYGLTSQLRRGSLSIASNIAEGCGRGSDADFGRCLQIGLGSASEVEYQLLLAHDLGLLGEATYQGLAKRCTEVKKMLTALIQKLTAES